MADKREIDGWRQGYQKLSDEELVAVLHELVPHCAQHIAAAQVLHARQQQRQESAAAEARTQHQASFAVGSRTLRWTIVAAVAAIVGAVLTAVALLLSANTSPPKATTGASTSSPAVSTPKSVSPAPAAASSTSTPAAVTPAAATPSPKTP